MTVCYHCYFFLITDITSILKETPTEFLLRPLLLDIRHKWYDIGLSLQVPRNVLDDLKQSQDDDVGNLFEVINVWKHTQPSLVTWETVISDIESPKIKEQEIADMIRQHLKLSKILLLSNNIVLLIL